MSQRQSPHSLVTQPHRQPHPKQRLRSTFSCPTVAVELNALVRRTSRSRRKLDMKQAAGRKGTVDEEQYILRSLSKLAARLIALQGQLVYIALNVRLTHSRGSREAPSASSSPIW